MSKCNWATNKNMEEYMENKFYNNLVKFNPVILKKKTKMLT